MAERTGPERTGAEPHAIEDHGLIGDRSTVALVAVDATIDFLCWPRFDSPTVFAALLDPEGGHFSLAPDLPGVRHLQSYLPDSNVLVTRFLAESGSAEVTDAMLPSRGHEGGPTRLIRRVRCTRGRVRFRLRCLPRFDYARDPGHARCVESGIMFETPTVQLRLHASVPLELEWGAATAAFELDAGRTADFVLDSGAPPPLSAAGVTDALATTLHFWRQWAGRSTYRGRWRETVTRSALLLKLLTSREHGSIIAAPTFGLPESPGGSRNWDYRAVWIRDASFTVYAFMRLGYSEEAIEFMHWIGARAAESSDGAMRIMYGVDGHGRLDEQILDHLAGYRGARPVRIGNEAYEQVQLDIYGELLDSIYLNNKYGEAISHQGWTDVLAVVDHICRHWRDADAGIWEMRDAPRHFLHSRLMCWVAVDRALRLADKRSLSAPFEHWRAVRNEIHNEIWSEFFDPRVGHFVQAKGTQAVDAALLLMPLVRFVSATDPQWLATLDAIRDQLTDDGLVFRYRAADGLEGDEGAFTACSFWYVECLARAGRLEEAHLVFEGVLAHANHLGLFSEQLGPTGRHLGNFPQALTHLALISAAFYLDRERWGRGGGTWRP